MTLIFLSHIPTLNQALEVISVIRGRGNGGILLEINYERLEMTSVHPNRQVEDLLTSLRIGYPRLTCGPIMAKSEAHCEGCQETLSIEHVVGRCLISFLRKTQKLSKIKLCMIYMQQLHLHLMHNIHALKLNTALIINFY